MQNIYIFFLIYAKITIKKNKSKNLNKNIINVNNFFIIKCGKILKITTKLNSDNISFKNNILSYKLFIIIFIFGNTDNFKKVLIFD